jgi:hypothetical protein
MRLVRKYEQALCLLGLQQAVRDLRTVHREFNVITSDEITALKAEVETLRRALKQANDDRIARTEEAPRMTLDTDDAHKAHEALKWAYVVTSGNKHPHMCPVCKGKGQMPGGYFSAIGVDTWSVGSMGTDVCTPCGGTGIVWG